AAREHYSAAWRTYGLSSFGASVNLNPAHQVAQLLTSLLDRVIIVGSTQTLEFLVATLNISQQTLGEGAVLDISQDVLHALLGTSIDNAWAGDVATELSGVRYRVVHVADAALEHEVNNQLELVQNLEVRHLWLVASFGQNLKTGLDQFLGATAQNCLLTEEVSDGLCLKGGWDNACACAADSSRIRQHQVMALTLWVLIVCDQASNTLAVNELTTNQVAWALGRNHADGDVVSWLDQVEVNVKTVTEEQCVALFQVWLNIIGKDLRLGGIWSQDHDDIGPLGCICNRLYFKASFLCLDRGLGAVAQANDYLYARVAQVLRVRVPLGAVTNNSDLAALDDRQISIVVVKSLN